MYHFKYLLSVGSTTSVEFLQLTIAMTTMTTTAAVTTTRGQGILTRGRIAAGFFTGTILCDTRLLLRPAIWNAGRQHAGKSRCWGHWEQCLAVSRKIQKSSSSKVPLPVRHEYPHLTHGFLGPPESSTQTASRLVQPFLQCSWS